MNKMVKSIAEQNDDENALKFLTFFLAGESYGFSIMRVKEIIEYGDVTSMPMMPEFICGAINLRGKAVPVIDLAGRLGLRTADVSRRTCIIVIELHVNEEMMNVGLVVDAVSRVIDFKADEIERTPSLGGHIRTDFIEAMGKIDEQFVILLNIDNVLSMNDLSALSQASESMG